MNFKSLLFVCFALSSVLALCGCSSSMNAGDEGLMYQASVDEKQSTRILISKASLSLSVGNVKEAVGKIENITRKFNGYVEHQNIRNENSADMKINVPSNKLSDAVKECEAIGSVNYRNMWTEDVTSEYVDLDAKIKNLTATRDRLKQLFEKSQNIQDILAVEKELTRVQTELDAIEGSMKALKNQISYASVDISIERTKIYGPLGYLFKGLWWGFEKLFVIQ